ncbi:MAG: hypothetical protein ABIT64_06300 [Lysobacteraceae bacterium]
MVRVIFIAILLVLGTSAVIGVWLVAAALGDSHAGWAAPLAALGSVALLRFAHVAVGQTRAMLATIITAITVVLANWLVIALPIAQAMDMSPLDAASRIGLHFAWTLTMLGSTPMDWLWMAVALALSAWLGR